MSTQYSVHNVKEMYIDKNHTRITIKVLDKDHNYHYIELFGNKIKVLEVPRKEWRFKE